MCSSIIVITSALHSLRATTNRRNAALSCTIGCALPSSSATSRSTSLMSSAISGSSAEPLLLSSPSTTLARALLSGIVECSRECLDSPHTAPLERDRDTCGAQGVTPTACGESALNLSLCRCNRPGGALSVRATLSHRMKSLIVHKEGPNRPLRATWPLARRWSRPMCRRPRTLRQRSERARRRARTRC